MLAWTPTLAQIVLNQQIAKYFREGIKMGNLLDVIAVDCVECNSAGFVFYGTEGTLVMPCECEGE